MMMHCRECKRAMNLWEFLTDVEAFLLKSISAAAVPFLMLAIQNQLSTKGFLDSQMAGLANNFEIVCPHCKKYVCWDSALQIEQSNVSQQEL